MYRKGDTIIYMKKNFYILMYIVLISFFINPIITSADILIPRSVSIGDKLSYESGSIVDLTLTDGKKPIGLQTNLDYGVAKAVESDGYTFFEIITTEYKDISKLDNLSNLTTEIPNILPDDATSTYVVYTKFYEKNNPENENFYFTKQFAIQANNTPFTQIANINLLQSNGNRFSISHGPSIYTLEKYLENNELATSSSIEITFESNQDIVINPRISFSKLRSDTFYKEVVLDPITIKKGETYKVIPLPTFEYDPGVYVGVLSFENDVIKNKVDFQYIVAGESVSVGTASVVVEGLKNLFKFEIFGTSIDMDRSDFQESTSTSASPMVYKTTVDFIDSKDNKVYSTVQNVDFNKNDFSVEIPSEYNDVLKVYVKVVSASDKVLYEGNKTVNYKIDIDNSAKTKKIVFVSLYIFFMLITIYAIYKRHVKVAILFALIILGMFLSKDAFADLVDLTPYRTNHDVATFTAQNYSMTPVLYLQDDITDTVYSCGQDIPVTFKIYYLRCTNTAPRLSIGFSWTNDTPILTTISPESKIGTDEYYRTSGSHKFYKTYSQFISRTLPPAPKNQSDLYIRLYHRVNTLGYSFYKIPIQTTCGATDVVCGCVGRDQICNQNGTQVSSTSNSPACALGASCSYDISPDGQNYVFQTIPINDLKAVTYKDTDTGKTITPIYNRKIVGTSTVVHNVTIKDSYDNSVAYASCSSSGGPGLRTGVATSTDAGIATIVSFQADAPVVQQGIQKCVYNWNVTDVDRCAVSINNQQVSIIQPGIVGPLSVSTDNGLNQRAVITCYADASSSTPASTVSTTTLCQVVPEVIER